MSSGLPIRSESRNLLPAGPFIRNIWRFEYNRVMENSQDIRLADWLPC
jgi:hypothetical protein